MVVYIYIFILREGVIYKYVYIDIVNNLHIENGPCSTSAKKWLIEHVFQQLADRNFNEKLNFAYIYIYIYTFLSDSTLKQSEIEN